jgi:hypothetical protein
VKNGTPDMSQNAPTAIQTSTALTSAKGGIQRFRDPEQAARAAAQYPAHVTVCNGTGTILVMSAEDAKAFKALGYKVSGSVNEDSEHQANTYLDPAGRDKRYRMKGRKPGWYVVAADGDTIVAGPFDSEKDALAKWSRGQKVKKLAGEGVTAESDHAPAPRMSTPPGSLAQRLKDTEEKIKTARLPELAQLRWQAAELRDMIARRSTGAAPKQTESDPTARSLDQRIKDAEEAMKFTKLDGRPADAAQFKWQYDRLKALQDRQAKTEARFEAGDTVMIPGRVLGKVVSYDGIRRQVKVELKGGRQADYGVREVRRVADDHELPQATRGDRAPAAHFSDATVEARGIRVSPEELDSLWDRYSKAETDCKEAGDGATRGQRANSSRTLNDFRRACQASNLDPVREVARRMVMPVGQPPADRHEAEETNGNQTMQVTQKVVRSNGVGPRFVSTSVGGVTYSIPRWDGDDSDLIGLTGADLEELGFSKSSASPAEAGLEEANGAEEFEAKLQARLSKAGLQFRENPVPMGKWHVYTIHSENGSSAALDGAVSVWFNPSTGAAKWYNQGGKVVKMAESTLVREGYEGPGWYVVNKNGDILSPQFDFESDAQTFHEEHLAADSDCHVSRVDDAGEMRESAGFVLKMAGGGFVVSDTPSLGNDTKLKDSNGHWIPVSGLVHSSDWDGVKFSDEASAKAALGEAEADFPSPEAYEDSSNPAGIPDRVPLGWESAPFDAPGATDPGPYQLVLDPDHAGFAGEPPAVPDIGALNLHFFAEIGERLEDALETEGGIELGPDGMADGAALRATVAGWLGLSESSVISNPSGFARVGGSDKPAMEDAETKWDVEYRIYGSNREMPLSTKTRTVTAPSEEEARKLVQKFFSHNIVSVTRKDAGEKVESRKVQSKFAGAEVDLDRWYVISDAARFLTPQSFASEQEAIAWATSQDGVDLGDGDAVIKGEEFVEIYDESAPMEDAGDDATAFLSWLGQNQEQVVVGRVEREGATTWLVGSKASGWGFLDIVGYWSEETGPVYSQDLSTLPDSDMVFDDGETIEHSSVQELTAAVAEVSAGD